jgi:hypothetical protein
MEVRGPDTVTGFVVFGCDDDDEDWETLSDEEEDTKDEKIETSLHEDEKPREYGADTNEELVIHDEPIAHDGDVWRSKLLDLRYVDASLAKVIMPSYKETSRQKMLRRVKKKEEVHSCIKSTGKLQLKVEEYEPMEDQIISQGQKKKAQNGRA